MEVIIFVFVIIGGAILFALSGGKKDFDDPQPMSNQHLLSAIAGQADWLEKMSRSPIESQNDPSIAEITNKKRAYISRLCLEALTRGTNGSGSNELTYPGATIAPNIFDEVADYAKKLEATGISKEIAAVRSVKEKLFANNGAIYSARWEP